MGPIAFPGRPTPEDRIHRCPGPDGMLVETGLGPWLDVRRFARAGTPADGVADWTDIIQAGIECIIKEMLGPRTLDVPPGSGRNVEFGTLYLPPGIYRLTRPLLIRFFAELDDPIDPNHARFFAFCGIEIAGDAPGTRERDRGASHGTILRADFSQQPAIVIQGGRSVHLRNLVIEGRNNWVGQAQARGQDPRATVTHTDETVYFARPLVLPGPFPEPPLLPRDNPNSPYAAVCVDPFFKDVPAANRYPGLEDLYDIFAVTVDNPNILAPSTNFSIEGCLIRGFVTGVVLCPPGQLTAGAGGQPANLENIRIADTTIESTVSALAIGQSQSRHVVLSNVNIFGAKYAINCVDYGLGTGDCPSIFGGTFSGVKYLFHCNSPGSAYAIEGLCAEGFWSIGQLFGGSRPDGYIFRGCRFAFGASPPALEVSGHLLNFANTIFDGCTFMRTEADDAPLLLYNNGRLSLRGCRFLGGRARGLPFFVLNDGAQARLSLTECEASTPGGLTPLGDVLTGVQPSPLPANLPVMPGTLLTVERAEGPSLRWSTGVLPRLDLGPGKIMAWPDGKGVFFRPDAAASPGHDLLKDLLLPGDLLFTGAGVPGARLPQPADPPETLDLRSGRLLAGVFREIYLFAGQLLIFFDHVPAALADDIAREPDPMPPRSLFMSYVPLVRPFTRGELTNGSPVIRNVSTEEASLSLAWRRGDRIQADGRALLVGTHVIDVADLVGEITVSMGALDGGPSRLFDADIRELSTPR